MKLLYTMWHFYKYKYRIKISCSKCKFLISFPLYRISYSKATKDRNGRWRL